MRFVLFALLVATAHADVPRDAIERARELEARLAYDEALAIIESAIQAGQSERDRLVELHLIAGRLAAGLDRAKVAEDHFAVVLALAPQTTLPDDTSPKISVPFTVARTKSQVFEARLVVTAEAIAMEPAVDPLGLLGGIAVQYRDGSTQLERTSPRVARRPGAIDQVRALDRFGNTLTHAAPPAEVVPQPPPPIVRDEPGLFGRWTTWAAITGVALAAGGVAVWRFDSAQNEFDTKREAGMTDFSDLEAIEDRGRRWALVANISFGVAAATAITSIVFFVRRDSNVAITTTGNTVGVAGRF